MLMSNVYTEHYTASSTPHPYDNRAPAPPQVVFESLSATVQQNLLFRPALHSVLVSSILCCSSY